MTGTTDNSTAWPLASIIILNWNGLADTIKCLESFTGVSYPNYRIYLVDNGSRGNDADIIAEKFGPKITLIRNAQNKGFPGGNNQILNQLVIEKQPGYSLLINNDTEVYPDFLSELVKVLHSNDKIGAVTAKLFNSDGTIQRSLRHFPTHFTTFASYCLPKFIFSAGLKRILRQNKWLHRLIGKTAETYFWDFDSDEPQPIDNASGACLMVRNEILTSVGLLDENIFLSFEDVDWCYRLRHAGWEIYYVPTAKVVHHVGRSTKKGPEKLIYLFYQLESKSYFAQKHFSPRARFVTASILIFALLLRLPVVVYYTLFSFVYHSNFTESLASRYVKTWQKIFTHLFARRTKIC
ncbi:TPA: hypothetical protein DF272_03385 [Candidatus Falkowbacteria bacterium]|nr:hypothetical protein [Candidatus Falkowbacteria bacterium]